MRGTHVFWFAGYGVAMLLFIMGAACAAEPQAHLVTDTWNFGEVAEGFVARGELTIENKGDAPLRILNIRGTCSMCSAASSTEDLIPPGGKTSIRIQFNSAGASGTQSKVLYVHTNDPKTPFFQLKVTGTVKRDPNRAIVALSMESWDAGLIYAGQPVETEFKIKNDGKRDLEILGVRTLAPLSVSCEKTKLAPGEETAVKVCVDPKDFRGILDEQVVVNTNDAVVPSKTVHVTGYVAKDARPTGKTDGAIVILPRDPVKLPGTRRVFYREYEITNNTASPLVLRCLSAEGHARLDLDEITLAPGASRVAKAHPGEKGPEEDRLSIGAVLVTYPPEQANPGK